MPGPVSRPTSMRADLEEIYCYFDMDEPHFWAAPKLHRPGDVDNIVAHPVKSGSMVLAPRGYHPTVASQGHGMLIFRYWQPTHMRAAGYDLAVLDPRQETDELKQER